ncbi:hypothetical protein [Mycobacterium sp. ZZG]
MARRTIAELAQRKADLIAELSDVNDEIRSRAGEVDPPGTESPDDSDSYVTATDAAAQRATDEAARTVLDALAAAKGE